MAVAKESIKLTPDLIYGFSASVLSSTYDEPAPTPDCHKEWWELCCSNHKRVAISAPRGHAKSTAITKAYTLASVLFRNRQFALVVSDTYKQAVLFLGEIKRELESNADLVSLFGIKGLTRDREDDIICEFDDGHQFRILALGSEQKVRGLLWDGRRPDLIVGDDLENDEIVMNPDRREKFRNWVYNALLPCMSEKGIIRIVGTILHMDAFLERLMPKERDHNSVRESPLILKMKKPKNGWMAARYAADADDSETEATLWPGKWPKERLRELFRMFKDQGNPEGYYQEYRNRPMDPSNSFFKKDDLLEFDDKDYERDWSYAPTYLSCDLALSVKERRDWCAFGVGSLDDQGTLYIRYVLRERMDSKEIVETISRLQDRFKFNTLLIGKGALEKSIGPFLRDQIRRQGKFLHIEAIPETSDKRIRAQAIRGRLRAGGVKIHKKAKWYPVFEEEMIEFDRGTHDDQVDMMALFGMFLDSLQDAPTASEIKTLEWEEEYNTEENLDFGRSIITGY